MEDFMKKGLFDPEHLKAVEEMRKGIKEDKDGYWAKLRNSK